MATVRYATWQALAASQRHRLPPDGWDRILAGLGVADADPLATMPLAPFNEALLRLDRDAGQGDGALVEEAARGWARAWGAANAAVVRSLRGDPARMLEVLVREVQPFLLDDPRAGRIVELGRDRARVALANGLLEPFNVGLLAAFVELAGCRATVVRHGDEHVVTWTWPEEPKSGTLARFLLTVRAPFLAATLVPVLLGTAVALAEGAFHGGWFLLGLVGAVLVHVGTNTANDWFGHRDGRDGMVPTPGPYGGKRAIQRGLASSTTVGWIAVVALGLAVAIGLALTATRGPGILVLGLAGFALGALYTIPQVNLAGRGLGEAAAALGFGPILVLGGYYVQTGAFALAPLVASLPVAALVAAVIVLNRGSAGAYAAHATLVAAAFVALVAGVALGALPMPALLGLAAAPFGWRAVRALPRHPGQASGWTVLVHLATGALVAVGFLLHQVIA